MLEAQGEPVDLEEQDALDDQASQASQPTTLADLVPALHHNNLVFCCHQVVYEWHLIASVLWSMVCPTFAKFFFF